MQVMLLFDMPDDEQLLREHLHAPAWSIAISNFDEFLRKKIKYEEHPEEVMAILDEVREKLHECVSEKGLAVF